MLTEQQFTHAAEARVLVSKALAPGLLPVLSVT